MSRGFIIHEGLGNYEKILRRSRASKFLISKWENQRSIVFTLLKNRDYIIGRDVNLNICTWPSSLFSIEKKKHFKLLFSKNIMQPWWLSYYTGVNEQNKYFQGVIRHHVSLSIICENIKCSFFIYALLRMARYFSLLNNGD